MVQGNRHRIKRFIEGILIAVFWLAVWQAASMFINHLYMPSPYETFLSLLNLVVTANFWASVGATLVRVVLGLVISFVLGIGLAYAASRSDILKALLRPFMTAVKSVPVVSIIMLAIIWFQASFVPVFSCVLMCFPIFYTNTLTGINSVSSELLEMAAVFKVSRRNVITGISIPSVLPHIYSALSVCLGFSWKSVVAAEALSYPKYSMGYNLYITKYYLKTPELFAWTVAVIIISVIIEKFMKRFLPGGGAI